MKGVQTFESEKKKKSRKDQNRGRKSEHSDQGTVNKMVIAKEPTKRRELGEVRRHQILKPF